MNSETKYLFRVQHNNSHSEYVAGIGVVATYHISKVDVSDTEASLKRLQEDACSSNAGNLKNTESDLSLHLRFKNEEPTSCVSTSTSLEFAMFWSQAQHQYRSKYKGIRILVIDISKIRQQGLKYWKAGPKLQPGSSSANFANSFDEWIVEVYIPISAIVQEISWDTIFSCRPDWYSRESVFKNGEGRFAEWKKLTLEGREKCSARYRQVRAIGFAREVSNHKENGLMLGLAHYVYDQLFQDEGANPTPPSAKELDLTLLYQIKCLLETETLPSERSPWLFRYLREIDVLPKTILRQKGADSNDSPSTSSSSVLDVSIVCQGYPEPEIESDSMLGITEKLGKIYI